MTRMKWFAILMLSGVSTWAQELNCRVVVNAEQIQSTERQIFKEMETVFAQFLNSRKWTDDDFAPEERIDCNIILTMNPNGSEPSSGRWVASVQILSSRPVYGTDYKTVLFNFADRDWHFEYLISQPLQFNDNSFTSNITSILAYYAYTIIGLDYDSFSELGGTKYYQIASQIVSNAQTTNYPGWNQFGNNYNRYWLNENILSANFEALRKAIYAYHIKALDNFNADPEAARNIILEGLKALDKVNRAMPRSILTVSFLDAKGEELSQIFRDGNPTQKRESYEILVRLDPNRSDVFKKIME